MAKVPTVTLELRTARESLQAAAAMVGFLQALPQPPRGITGIFRQAPELTVEFLNQGQTIYVLLTVPASLQEYVSSQLTAAYPEVLIKALAHQPLDEFRHLLPKAMGELVLSSATYYPLRSFRETGDLDPLAGLLAALAKLQEGEAAVIQVRFRKARDNWQHGVQTKISGTESAASPVPHAEQVKQKLSQPSYSVRIYIIGQAQTQERATQIVDSLVGAFSAFQSQSNSLVLRKPFLRKHHYLDQILLRTNRLKKQYFSQDELATLFHLPNKQLSTIKNIAWGKNLLGEPPENLPTFGSIPEAERDNVNFFAKAEFKNQEQIFGLKQADRRRHLYVVGKSGTGKSTLLANMIINDLKHGQGLAVVDPHGDLVETVLDYIPKHRINDVIIVDPADVHAVVKLNLFEGGTLVHRELIASGIVAIFQKMYANSWGPRLEYILRNALLTLLSRNAKLEDVLKILTDANYRAKVVAELDDPVLKNFWEAEFNTMQDKLRSESISPILNKVGQFVTSPLIRHVVNTTTSSFSIEDVMNQGKILLVNVSQGKLGEDNAALLGAMIITKIQLAAMNRVYTPEEQRRDFNLYIDEFQNFATTSFVKILSEARKYRLNLTLANQYMAQIPDEVKAAIFGNAGSMISFILGAQDAEWMIREFGGQYTQEDLVSLSRYQIITKLMIDNQASRAFPAVTLGLAASRNFNKEKVLRVSKERFAKKRE